MAAELLQTSVLSEDQVYRTFKEQIANLGLRGGIALLSEDRSSIKFRAIAQPGRRKLLSRLESLLNLKAPEFSIGFDQVDVYHQVLMQAESVYVSETSAIIRQMVSVSEESVLSQLLEAFGRDPAIYSPLIVRDRVEGVINVAGKDITYDDLPAMKAFANFISTALSNARLFGELKGQEEAYRSLFDNLPLGIFRVTPEGRFQMANPVFLEQIGVESFEQISGKTLEAIALKPLHDRSQVYETLERKGEILRLETEWETEDGERRFFVENIKASLDRDGDIEFYEGSIEEITNRRLAEMALKKQLDDLMILNQVAAVGAGASTLEDLVSRVTKIIGSHLFSDHFEIFLWQEDEGVLKKIASYSNEQEDLTMLTMKPEEGVVGQVFRAGMPMIVEDVLELPNYVSPNGDFRSELCVPIQAGNRVTGVLNAERKKVGGFSWEDQRLLTTIADQFATAYDRLNFFEEVENQALQLALLNEAVLSTSRILDPEELIMLIAAQIQELFKPDSFVMSLYSETRQELEVAIAVTQGERDTYEDGTRIPLEQAGLIALVVETGQVLHVEDLASSPLIVGYDQFHTRMEGSWAGVPLISGKKVIGALAVQYFDKILIDKDQTQFLVSMASHAAIAISNGKILDDVQARFALSRQLAEIGEKLNRSQTYQEVVEIVGTSAFDLMGNTGGAVYKFLPDGQIDCAWISGLPEEYLCEAASRLVSGRLKKNGPLIVNDTSKWDQDDPLRHLSEENDVRSISFWPLVFEGEAIAVVGCFSSSPHEWTEDEQEAMQTLARQSAVAIQNAQLLEAERIRRLEAEALYKTTAALTSTLDVDKVLNNILVELYRVIDYTSASLQMLEGETVRIVAAQGLLLEPDKVVGMEYSASNELFSLLMKDHEPLILENAIEDERFELVRPVPYVRGWIAVPLVVGENMIGALTIDSDQVGAFNEADAEKAQAFANQAAIAIETASLFTQTQRRLNVLQSIHTIDQAISRSMDLSMTLDVFLEQALNLLDVDVIRIFSYDNGAQVFEPVATRDQLATGLFGGKEFFNPQLAEAAVLARSLRSHISDKAGSGLMMRSLASYFVIPLFTRGEIRGVIEVLSRKKLAVNDEWLDLLNTLATQAGIAIENEELLTSLRRSNEELISAYDRTLEGWAYALELRDRETVGHSRRVTDLTLRLSRRMGITGIDLANIRRGTLLHDIGKMGLPDSVLLKKGPLTKEEEQIMKTHPQLAYDMLVAIPYLKPALDIPYFHHEKWDGTGYPHGLKGEDIPLAARIFSVVDVWDAVVFDRPYREAWSRLEALAYIKDQSGQHFDPRVVEHFVEIIGPDMERD